jgi:cytochrome oxidase assembly protein ShyY1
MKLPAALTALLGLPVSVGNQAPATLARVRFLFTRRWVLFALTVGVLAWGAYLLGQWQFGRLHDTRDSNTLVARNLDEAPVPVADLLKPAQDPSNNVEWRKVVVHGTWDAAHTIVLKYQTRDGGPGVELITPLVTCKQIDKHGNDDPADDTCAQRGPAMLVDRTNNSGDERPKLPAINAGPVTVIGWVRQNGSGGATTVSNLATRAISSDAAAAVLNARTVGYDLYGGFLDIDSEAPQAAKALGAIELPNDTSDGPHFFYGLQWWFFAALAIFGFGFLAYDETKLARAAAASKRALHPAVDGEHHASNEG